MTTFKAPVKIGDPDPGIPALNNQGLVVVTQQIRVSGDGRTGFIVVPPNSRILPATRAAVVSAIAGSAAQANLVLGDGTTQNWYGAVVVSGQRTYDFVFNNTINSAASTIQATLQPLTSASAEGFTDCKTLINVVYTVVA